MLALVVQDWRTHSNKIIQRRLFELLQCCLGHDRASHNILTANLIFFTFVKNILELSVLSQVEKILLHSQFCKIWIAGFVRTQNRVFFKKILLLIKKIFLIEKLAKQHWFQLVQEYFFSNEMKIDFTVRTVLRPSSGASVCGRSNNNIFRRTRKGVGRKLCERC